MNVNLKLIKMKNRYVNIGNMLLLVSVLSVLNFTFSQRRGNGVFDADSNFYETVRIGKTEWMTENLKTTTYSNGNKIEDKKHNFSNVTKDSPLYKGSYYTWYSVNDERNVCPTGWKVPSNSDWNYVENRMGGYEYAAIDMKIVSNEYWSKPNLEATNYSGFSAIPEGYINDKGDLTNQGKYGYWWTSEEFDKDVAWGREIGYNHSYIFKGKATKKDGLSVRCMRYVK